MGTTANEWTAFFCGIGFALVVLLVLTSFVPGSALREAKMKRQDCEKSLPRDQNCVMRYEPEPTP